MSDYLLSLSQKPITQSVLAKLGLPTPRTLTRAQALPLRSGLQNKSLGVAMCAPSKTTQALIKAVEKLGARLCPITLATDDQTPEKEAVDACLIDATSVSDGAHAETFFQLAAVSLRQLKPGGRLLVLGPPPERMATPSEAAYAQGIEGFVKSVAKEAGKKGINANLVWVESSDLSRLLVPALFFLSPHSAYVSGQAIKTSALSKIPRRRMKTEGGMSERPLQGKTALVTGASGGIGAATARRLASSGATVLCLDIPAAQQALQDLAKEIGGGALCLDITSDKAPATILNQLQVHGGALDILVHNAGITRDKTLKNMTPALWNQVLQVNLEAILRIDQTLLGADAIASNGRLIYLSSISGIAGNAGQTNYAFSKAALMGYIGKQSQQLANKGITANAIAPGFIETPMTASLPVAVREAGRRLNALSQGGRPEDVAEAIAFFADPEAGGITGQTLRVCGASYLGR